MSQTIIDLFNTLITDDNDFDMALETLNDVYGHSDLNKISNYQDMKSINNNIKNTQITTVLHINIRSVLSKLDAVSLFVNEFHVKPSFVVCTETWLDPMKVNQCNLPGYSSHHVYRDTRATLLNAHMYPWRAKSHGLTPNLRRWTHADWL